MIQLLRMREAKKRQTSELASESINGGEERGTPKDGSAPIQREAGLSDSTMASSLGKPA